jgi:nucleotide-binding universal stress UspA family protein
MSEYKNILICTDFSEHANTAFVHAVDWAKKDDAKLHIFNVIMPDDPCGNAIAKKSPGNGDPADSSANGEDIIQQTIGALKLKYKDSLKAYLKDFEFVVKIGTPDVEIIKYAKQSRLDMIILGALGIPEKDRATRVRTAANVSKFAPCQVVVIQKNVQQAFGI